MAKSSEFSDHQRSKRKLPPSPRVAPWLVYEHGKDCKFQTFYNICDPLSKSYGKFIPELSGKIFWQKPSHQGWLIILCYDSDPVFKYGDCFLWNPASSQTIQLPNFLHCVSYEYRVQDCCLSSPPQSSCNTCSGGEDGSTSSVSSSSDDSMVYMLLSGGENPKILIYCHPGGKEWRKHEFVDVPKSPEAILYSQGKLRVMCMSHVYFEIAIQHGSDTEDTETLSISDPDIIGNRYGLESVALESVAGALVCRFKQYYIESFGEVFKIDIHLIMRGIYQNCVTGIDIWKLDIDSMTWEEVKRMDDYVFFLSDVTQLSCLASDLGLSKGCVYFTQPKEMSLYKYDLEDNSILLSLPCPDLPSPWSLPEWVMITSPTRAVDRRETAECILGKDKIIEAVENRSSIDKDDEEEETEETRCWAMLNDDIIWLIASYLHTLDYVHLRAVSKRYRSINSAGSAATGTLRTTNISPWLVFFKYDEVYNFVNPMHDNENFLMHVPESLKGSRIRFSKGGWFLMTRCGKLFFYNPFTRSSIKLPDLPDNRRYYSGISFSSLPTCSDCLVFAFCSDKYSPNLNISFIKRGNGFWTHCAFDNTYLVPTNSIRVEFEADFNNPVFHRGAFYCLDLNGTLGVFSLEPDTSWEFLAMVPRPKCEFIYKSFLVECEGKLLCVLLGHLGKWVRIFGLNETEMVWVEVKNLGRHMLFLSNTSCISAVAPTGRQMENKIYFSRLHNEGILFYSLDTGMYHSVGCSHSAKDYRDSKENLHCSWIEPSWSATSDYYLDWLNL